MKTPEKIKEGLKCCNRRTTLVYEKCDDCPYHGDEECMRKMELDALDLIGQLEAKLAEYEKPLVPIPLYNIATNTRFLLPCWIETKTNMWPDVLDRDSVGNYGKIDNRERVTVRYLMDADYGKTWRCWSHRPTRRERRRSGMMLDTRRMLLNTALRFNRVYSKELNHQAADLIDELYWELVQVKRERDAAADDIELGVCCETCKHDNDDDEGAFCVGCVRVTSRGNWEWRGVKNNAE